jgi:sensory rhodopsin
MVDITLWFTLGTIGMVLGTGLLAYGLLLVPDEKRRPFLLVVGVPGIAAVAYGIMALGYGGLETATGTTVFVPRYVDWLLTTPIHVVFIGLIVAASTRLLARVATLQALTIVFGFVGATLAAPLNWAFYLLGSAAFGAVVYYFYRDFESLSTEQTDGIQALFRKLRSFVVVLWLVYPVIWLVGVSGVGLMDLETTALVVSYIDVVAKVGFGLIALNEYVNLAEQDVAEATIQSSADLGDDPATAD